MNDSSDISLNDAVTKKARDHKSAVPEEIG